MAGTRVGLILSFLLPILTVSPLAYYLISVHRSPLPLKEIHQLPETLPGKFQVRLQLLHDEATRNLQRDELQHELNMKMHSLYNVQLSIKSAILEDRMQALEASDLDNYLKEYLDQTPETSQYSFFLLCLKDSKISTKWTIGKYRHGWINSCNPSPERELGDLVKVLQQHLLPSPEDLQAEAAIALSYRLTFSLLNENPRDHAATWDFPSLGKKYLSKFLEKVQIFANFTIESQVLQYAQLAQKAAESEEKRIRCVSDRDLQQFKSANDWSTTTVLSDREQNLNFLMFVPSPKRFPLLIHEAGSGCNADSGSIAFEIPGWGGVVVHQREEEASSEVNAAEMKQPMGFFVAHFRNLLGAPNGQSGKVDSMVANFLISSKDGITDWEIDVMSRSWIYRYLLSTTQTLKSIAKLVQDMPHMSVLERIQRNVNRSLELLNQSYAETLMTDTNTPVFNYKKSLSLVREAAGFADAAYYDATMVPQLYFPEEHLYAVYLPLLAPLVPPLLFGLVREVKRYKLKSNK